MQPSAHSHQGSPLTHWLAFNLLCAQYKVSYTASTNCNFTKPIFI